MRTTRRWLTHDYAHNQSTQSLLAASNKHRGPVLRQTRRDTIV